MARRGARSEWPASLHAVGQEPDPRFSLANVRTLLAWVRTTLALLAAAVAIHALDLGIDEGLQEVMSVALAGASACFAFTAWRSWYRVERALRLGEPLPSDPGLLLLILVIGIASVVLAFAMVTG